MNKVVGLVGAISGLATLDGAQAGTVASPNTAGLLDARSYAELLEPVPNALAVLRAMDAADATRAAEAADPNLIPVQYHHHHHHRHWRHHHHHHHHRWWRRHHHHHHHHRYGR
jgi:hypothetical protein